MNIRRKKKYKAKKRVYVPFLHNNQINFFLSFTFKSRKITLKKMPEISQVKKKGLSGG